MKSPISLRCPILVLCLLGFSTVGLSAAEKLKALIMDGQNNHAVWPKSSIMMRPYLQDTGMFEVDIARTASIWKWEREENFLRLAGVGESKKSKASDSW